MSSSRSLIRLLPVVLLAAAAPAAIAADDVEKNFTQEQTNLLVMQVEAAISRAQADVGVVSREAAEEIARTANLETVPIAAWDAENDRVRHRLVAVLNVWRRSLSPEASDALHLGPTTVDIYDAVMVLQLRRSIVAMRNEMFANERVMVELAEAHRNTPMVGRTLGQHALPITFGKKVAVWAAANRRNVARLDAVYCRLGQLGVLRGAVGTHLGLGDQAVEVERRTAEYLGLGPLDPADWHGLRDVFGEYASVLALVARVNAAVGQEVFMLQMTDIGEVYERRSSTAVSSSTMPHKRNPSRSEALIFYGQSIPAQADVLLDDVANVFERDNTSRPNRALEQISIDAHSSIMDTGGLLARLVVDPGRMEENLLRTDGMIMAQRVVFELVPHIGKEAAEERVAKAAERAVAGGTSFRSELLADRELAPHLRGTIDALLDYRTYLGDSAGQVDRTIAALENSRSDLVCAP